MSNNAFLRGMKSINLFPKEREIYISTPVINILSEEQAMKKDIEQVANDFHEVFSKEPLPLIYRNTCTKIKG